MNICVLTSTYNGSSSVFSDYDTDQFHLEDHFHGHRWEVHPLQKNNAAETVRALTLRGFDIFVNLCDGAADEDRAGIEVVRALQERNVPYTGADPDFYEPTRQDMKEACAALSIRSPRFILARGPDDVSRAAEILSFPLFVKHPNSYGSIGTSRKSRVDTPAELPEQAGAMIGSYGGALIEEFIDGREFSVLIVENAADPGDPYAYPPLELVFPEGETFNHFGMKWSDDTKEMGFRIFDESPLAERLMDTGKSFFTGMRGSGYGRCDIRTDGDGEIYVLEINPNCTLFGPLEHPGPYSSDFMIMNDRAGFPCFIDRIFNAAYNRIR